MAQTLTWITLDQIANDQPLGIPKQRLIESMRRFGQMKLVHVRRREDGTFDVVQGQLFAAAARAAGLETLDVIVEDGADAADPADRKRIATSTQRENTDQLYLGRCIAQLIAEGKATQAELAREFDISAAHISHLLRVLECPDLVAAMEQEGLVFNAAKVIAGLPPEERESLLRELRAHRAVKDRFPAVDQIARRVAERQGREIAPVIPPQWASAVVEALHARGCPTATELRGGRRKQLRVTLSVEPEDLEWIAALIQRRAGEADAVDQVAERASQR